MPPGLRPGHRLSPWRIREPQPRQPGDAPCRAPQLDPENTGFIGVETFASLVHSHELPLDPAKLDMLVALAQGNDEGQVCYQELVDLVSAGGAMGMGASSRVPAPGWALGTSLCPWGGGQTLVVPRGVG